MLETIFDLVVVLVCPALTVLAIGVFFRLRKMNRMLSYIGGILRKMFGIVSCMKIQDDFDHIEKLQEILGKLLENERLEEASKLKNQIEKLREQSMEAVKELNETFGDIAELDVFKIKRQ